MNILKDYIRYTLYLLFVLLSFSVFLTAKKPVIQESVVTKAQTKTVSYEVVPIMKLGAKLPWVTAESVYAIDLDSNTPLYEKMPDKPQLPASTAKIITALVSLDYYPENVVLKVGKLNVEGQKMGLIEGEQIKFEDLLAGLLIYSANDAAEVLAQNFPAGREMFISAMNLKTKELTLTNTRFVNPAGLDGSGQTTSARDLVRVATYAMENQDIAKIVATKELEVMSVDGRQKHKLVNVNKLLGEVDGVLGVKTGWTENAQENLVTYVERDGKRVMIALLASEDRFGETQEIIDWIFENFEWRVVEVRD